MPNHSDARNARNKTTLSLSLAILIIIMDMSGLAGLAAQEELEEVQEKRETLSGVNMPGFQTGLANSSTTFDIAYSFACAILSDGGIYCWGDNDNYHFGDGTLIDSQLPTPTNLPVGLTAEHISIGEYSGHHCAILSDSNAYCWGYNYPAGVASPSYNMEPAQVPLDSTVSLVESADTHSCAILSNGSVQCWGNNYYGQLGIGYTCEYSAGDCQNEGSDEYLETPVYPLLPPNSVAVGLNLWAHNTCVILENTSYYCFGDYWNSPWPTYKKTGIAAASGNVLMHSEQTVEYWSQGYSHESQGWYGSIYIRNQANNSAIDTGYLPDSTRFISFVGNSDYYQWVYNSIGLLSNGTVVLNDNYEYTSMGINNALNDHGYLSRTFYEAPSNLNVAGVSTFPMSTSSPTCIIYDNGSAQCWGHYLRTGSSFVCSTGAYDQFGNPTGCTDDNYVASPVWVEFPTGLHIELDEMDDDGDGVPDMIDRCPSGAIGWTSTPSSDNDSDGCRDSDEDDDDDNDGYPDSVDTQPLLSYIHHDITMEQGFIIGGRYENVTVTSSFPIYGTDYYYISEAEADDYRSISFPGSTYLITNNGELVQNNGNSMAINWGLSEVLSIVDSDTDCAILENGELRCWGSNHYRTVGPGQSSIQISNSVNVSFPVNYPVTQVSTGSNSAVTCAVLENGEAYCWGSNGGNWVETHTGSGIYCGYNNDFQNGCNGNGYFEQPTSPVIIPDGTKAISAHAYAGINNAHACVVLDDGNAVCWGDNSNGELGDGTLNDVYASESPTLVYLPPGISSSIVTMALSAHSSCALFDNGSIYC